MRKADTEVQSISNRRMDSTSLLCEHPRVTPEDRNDGRTQGNSGNFATNDRQRRERVKAEEVGNPEAGCTDFAGLVRRKSHV
jgi:hypothetical protein